MGTKLIKRILGANCTAGGVFLAVTTGTGADFKVISTEQLAFSMETADGIIDLHRTLRIFLANARSEGVERIAVLKCSSGPRGSSVDAIKAEAILELISAAEVSLQIQRVAPQGLPKTLDCDSGQKWRVRAKQLFNPKGEIKHWNGTDGAVCAAYKAATL
jgi:hypothetical protein